MLLRPFLIPKGQYTEKGLHGLKNKVEKRRRTRQHKSKEGEERKNTGSINCEFRCVECIV